MGSVSKLTPYDTTGIKDVGVRAIISLAVSLGWNVVLKPHNPCQLIAKDGARLRVPTDSSVNDGVFQGYLSTIMSHSVEHTPTIELMDSVIATNKKLSESHQRRLRLAVGETAKQHRERMAAFKEGPREMAQGEHLTQKIEVPTEWVRTPVEKRENVAQEFALVDAKPHIVSEKPFQARANKGWSYPSPGVLERVWSDGHKDYRCIDCDYTGRSPANIGGHRKIHKPHRPDVPAKVTDKVPVSVPPTIIQQRTQPTPERVKEMERVIDKQVEADLLAENVIDRIRELVMPATMHLLQVAQDEVNAHREEMAQLRAENQKLKDDWAALQSLLNPGRES